MGSAALSWLLSEGVGLLLGAFSTALLAYLGDKRAAKAQHDTGRLEAERDQARETTRVQVEIIDQAAKRVDEDEALKRLEDGSA